MHIRRRLIVSIVLAAAVSVEAGALTFGFAVAGLDDASSPAGITCLLAGAGLCVLTLVSLWHLISAWNALRMLARHYGRHQTVLSSSELTRLAFSRRMAPLIKRAVIGGVLLGMGTSAPAALAADTAEPSVTLAEEPPSDDDLGWGASSDPGSTRPTDTGETSPSAPSAGGTPSAQDPLESESPENSHTSTGEDDLSWSTEDPQPTPTASHNPAGNAGPLLAVDNPAADSGVDAPYTSHRFAQKATPWLHPWQRPSWPRRMHDSARLPIHPMWPGQTRLSHPRATDAGVEDTSAHTLTVQRGDSLWSLTHQLLALQWRSFHKNARRAAEPPTQEELDAIPTAAIAQAWPVLYHANVDRIGKNPHLIHPGMVLDVPTSLRSDDNANLRH